MRVLLASTALALLSAGAVSADPASRDKLVEILRNKEVASSPERLLHAIGSQNLSLTRGEMIGALSSSDAPRQARHLLSVGESLESKGGRVEIERMLHNGVETSDGRVMAFGAELSYWVQGRDLVGVRGLHVAKNGRSPMERLRVVRKAAPEPKPLTLKPTDPTPATPSATKPAGAPMAPSAAKPVGATSNGGAPMARRPATPAPTHFKPAAPASRPTSSPTPRRGTTAPAALGISSVVERYLGPGANGNEIRAMQEQLNKHRPAGSPVIGQDGKFGPETEAAVKTFQRQHNLPETGVIDPATRKTLESAKLLSKGDRGAEVSEVQRLLNARRERGPALEHDEDFGSRTEQAVKDFQRAEGLPETGAVDPATLAALRKADPKSVSAATLKRGQKSDQVASLQKRLNEHRRLAGLNPLTADGKFGPDTEGALKEFQRAKGLPETGAGDVGTAAELSKAATLPSMSRGDRGPAVKALQEELNKHRAAKAQRAISEDGTFGAGTEAALKDFQRAQGLAESGSSDTGTATELSKSPPRPRLKRGDSGDAVKALQKSLNAHRQAAGRATIPTDGKFGPETKRAIEDFQGTKGLPKTGALDPATGGALTASPVEVAALKRGDSGAGVKALQRGLNNHRLAKGERAIPVDGKFGTQTEDALKAFQTAKGVTPSGEASATTQSLAAGSSAPAGSSDGPGAEAGSPNTIQANAASLEILARIVKGECPAYVPWAGKVAVAAVVLNRVRSRRFPNTIRGVAHQPAQFSCYNRKYRRQLYDGRIPEYAWRAARTALAGQDPSRGATFYFNPFLVNPSWKRDMVLIRRIGNPSRPRQTTHDFYRPKR